MRESAMKWHHLLAMTILAQPLVMASASAQQAAGQAGQAAAAAGQGGQGGQGQAAQGQGQGGGGGRGMGMGIGTPVGDEYSYPAGIAIGKSKIGPIFVDAK